MSNEEEAVFHVGRRHIRQGHTLFREESEEEEGHGQGILMKTGK